MRLLRPFGPILPASAYSHLWFKGAFPASVHGARFLMHHEGTQLENEVFWRGSFVQERGTVLVILRLLRSARTFLDIGANTGFYTLLAKSSNPSIAVIAVEPSPASFRVLERNIALNGFEVKALHAALTDRDGEVTLHDFPDLSYTASLEADWREGTLERRVRGHMLDTIVEQFGVEREGVLAKVDVEGHEPAVLRGAVRTAATGAQFVIEIIRDAIAAEIAELLPPQRYQYCFIDESSGALRDVSAQLAGGRRIPPGNYLIRPA